MICDKCGQDKDVYGTYPIYYGLYKGSENSSYGNTRITKRSYQIVGNSIANICDKCIISGYIKRQFKRILGIFFFTCLLFIGEYYYGKTIGILEDIFKYLLIITMIILLVIILRAYHKINIGDEKFSEEVIGDSKSKDDDFWGFSYARNIMSKKMKDYDAFFTPQEYNDLMKF